MGPAQNSNSIVSKIKGGAVREEPRSSVRQKCDRGGACVRSDVWPRSLRESPATPMTSTFHVVLLFVLAARSAWCGGPCAGSPCFVSQPVPGAWFVSGASTVGRTPEYTCCRYSTGIRQLPAPRKQMRLNAAPAGEDGPSTDDMLDGKRFVSRKLTDALMDMPAQPAPKKRTLVRKAASRVVSAILSAPGSLTRRLFGTAEPPPFMGGEEEARKMAAMRTASTQVLTGMSNTQTLAAEAKAEDERVFDLLDKYSRRHSNGTVRVTATISAATERKQVQKSKYANLYDPEQEEIKQSKSGKLLQKSRYADLWSAQDKITNPQAATKSVTKPPVEPSTTMRSNVAKGAGNTLKKQPNEPPSRLEQLMSRCGFRQFFMFATQESSSQCLLYFQACRSHIHPSYSVHLWRCVPCVPREYILLLEN